MSFLKAKISSLKLDFKEKYQGQSDKVWLLNLDQIEQHTGKILSKEYVSLSEIGNSTHFFSKGTLLYSKLRPYLNKVVIADTDGFATTELVPINCDLNKVDPSYLAYFLRSEIFLTFATNVVAGAKMPRMVMGEFWNYEIPLPPLSEQRRIVSILNQANDLRQKRQQAIEMLDQLLQATFINMFGDPNTYQNRFPIKSLKEVCTKITDGEHGTVERLESGKLYLMARNITKNMTLDITEVSYISEEDHQRIYKRCSPEFGDIMIVCVGATIGKLCLVPDMEEFSLARSVALLKPDNNSVISQYLLHLLASDYMQQKILNSRNTAAQAGLYLGKLSIIEVPVPPKELQEKWSKIALSIEDQKLKLYKQLDIQNLLFISLQNQAFSGTL